MNNRNSSALALLLALLMPLSGCMSVADAVGYDTASLNNEAAKSYTEVVKQAQSRQMIDTTSNTSRRIHAVFNRLKPYANQENRTGVPFDWQMTVVKSNELNAWAMPGGKMMVYTGIVDKLNLSDDEIAAVVGHEMSHALNEHSKKAVGQQVLTGLATSIGGAILQSQTGVSSDTLNLGSGILSEYGINMPFSRSQENEADSGGLYLMAKAGYNPEAALSVWQKMNNVSNNNNALVALTSSHPTNNARMEAIRRQLPQVMPIYEQARRK